MLKEALAGYGVTDILHVVLALPKIEFDDLRKLEGLCLAKPELAQRVVQALISYRGESFMKEITDILKGNI